MWNTHKIGWKPIGLAAKDRYTYPQTAEVLRVTITPAMPATAHNY